MSGGILLARPASKSRADIVTNDLGFVAETFNRGMTNVGLALGTQQILTHGLGLRSGDTVTNLHCEVVVAGAGTAPTLIKMALLSKTGVVLAQSVNEAADAKWLSTGMKTVAMVAAYAVPADAMHYVAILSNGAFVTTPMQIVKVTPATGPAALGANPFLTARQTGQTDFQATLGTQTLSINGAGWWFGVS